MTKTLENILGPRVPAKELRARGSRYAIPTFLLLVTGVLIVASFFQPYWKMKLEAPQYPNGLYVTAYLSGLKGDVHEIDGLNHYIGMRPLNDAAQFERANSAMMVGAVAFLLVAAILIHSRWAALAALPALLFPAGFLLDLQFWLATFGTNLNPKAPLSSSIKPFVPPVLGVGTIGQFRTLADPGPGLWMAVAASVVVILALYFHRRAYKPLFDARVAQRRAAASGMTSAVMAGMLLLLAPSAARAQHDDMSPAEGARREPAAARAPQAESPLDALIRDAVPGATIRVAPGTYRGMVTIDRPVKLVAEGDVVLDGCGAGDVVRITAPDVTLSGFDVRGTGAYLDEQNAAIAVHAPRATIENNRVSDSLIGILLDSASDSLVRGNRVRGKALPLSRRGDGIRLWNSHGVCVEDNDMADSRDLVVWYSRDARLHRNAVRNSRYGLHFMYATGAVVEENRFEDNSVGVFVMYTQNVTLRRNVIDHNRGPSGYGIGLKDMDGLTVEENVILSNRMGLYVDNSPSRIDVEHTWRRNVFAYNDVALGFLPAVQRNHFTENEFLENIEQVAILGSGELRANEFSVAGRGNYWSDYNGFDAGGDGIGDQAYAPVSLFENLLDREPKLRLFLYSPAQQAIDLASRAFPIMRPAPKMTDAAPLTRPIALSFEPRRAASPWPTATAGTVLVGIAALVWTSVLRGRLVVASPAATIVAPVIAAAEAARAALPQRPRDAATAASAILRVNGLSKRFGRHAVVDGFSLDVAPGAAVALWGTNGAGKTTIIKCMLGLHRCRGRVEVAGIDAIRRGKLARRQIGYVSQELAFYDDLGTRDTAVLFARLKRVPVARADEVLARVGLAEHGGKRVGALSGGMKQRLALGVALLADPPVLLLDEPTSNLDAAARRDFFGLLRDLKQSGKTILFTTHRADEVAQLADRVVELERGRVVRDGPAESFASECRLRIPLPDGERSAARALLADAGFDVRSNGAAIYVRVPAARNASPLAHLLRAGVAVRSFEVDSGDNT